jgi:hypothetical protein
MCSCTQKLRTVRHPIKQERSVLPPPTALVIPTLTLSNTQMRIPLTLLALIFLSAATCISAPPTPLPNPSTHLDEIATAAVKSVQTEFAKDNLKDDEVAVTIISLKDPNHLESGSYHGEAQFYPASVVKLFYLVAAEQWLEDKKLTDTPELQRGLTDMIVTSNNAACQYILDAVTEAPNGHELPPAEMEKWTEKRNAVNRYFASLGYSNINTNQKTYIDGPYGIDKIFNNKGANRNQLTTAAAARLMSEIVQHKIVTPERCDAMLTLLQRDPTKKAPTNPDDQNSGFTAKSLEPGDKLWSKAGWTNTSRHDVAYVETHDGLRLVLVVFTNNHGNHRHLIPAVAKSILQSLRTTPAARAE